MQGRATIEVTAAGVEILGHESHVLFTPPDGMRAIDPVPPAGAASGQLTMMACRTRRTVQLGATTRVPSSS